MPQIIPIKDLKKTSEISEMCHNTNEPVFITKNGYGDMVIMSMEVYEETMKKLDIYIIAWFTIIIKYIFQLK
jgi:PHD/YefM family antitoxin component YafN of YafNO toxin-antitoxin module